MSPRRKPHARTSIFIRILKLIIPIVAASLLLTAIYLFHLIQDDIDNSETNSVDGAVFLHKMGLEEFLIQMYDNMQTIKGQRKAMEIGGWKGGNEESFIKSVKDLGGAVSFEEQNDFNGAKLLISQTTTVPRSKSTTAPISYTKGINDGDGNHAKTIAETSVMKLTWHQLQHRLVDSNLLPSSLPTTTKPTTITKDNEDGTILSLTPNETIIDLLNNAINSITNTNPSSNENLSENGLPTFMHVPSSDSMCHTDANNRTDETIAAYCKDVTCMHHEKDVDDELFVSLGEDASKVKDMGRGGCKMLWFAAMHESDDLCKFATRGQHAYNVDYSIALNSALKNAHDSLQPVLLLLRLGMENENSTEPKKFGMWAKQRGVKVIYVPQLSFQDDVNSGLLEYLIQKNYGRLGTFLRLDIPKFVKEHSLFDMPNVCKHNVLYTDVDVIFANRITQQDVTNLSKLTGQAIVSYGREYSKLGHILNTGVMVMNVERFEQELPKMLQQARDAEVYPGHDQELMNNYREANDALKEKFQLLPMHYNWKAYWGLEPSAFSQVKIIHFHGPKLGRGLEVIAKCNLTAISLLPPAYTPHLHQGICCDRGRTAVWSIKAIHLLKAPIDHICDIADQS